jgi:hypothetical protein
MNQSLLNAQERALNIVTSKLDGFVPNGKIQYATLRTMLKLVGDTKTLDFQFKDTISRNADLENLLKEADIALAYGLGFGICRVPIIDGKEYSGNAVFISYPHEDVFPKPAEAVAAVNGAAAIPAEKFGVIDAMRGLFNGKMSFITNQSTRLENIMMSDYMLLEQQTTVINYGIKIKPLPRSYPLMGGKENKLVLAIPGATNLEPFIPKAGDKHTYYAVYEMGVILVVGSTVSKEATYKKLTEKMN